MKKGILYLILFVLVKLTYGFHIVGGEIEFETLEVGRYKISLVQYRDAAQTDNTEYEDNITVVIFSNKDNQSIRAFNLFLISISEVPYSNQECSIDELKTEKVLYSAEFTLDPMDFSDEEGYYIVWERCCRNHSIVNIDNPGNTGMKYVLEIPPLWKNDSPFINSSPTLLRPLSDYACVGQLYYTEFTGTDPDGDSLTYRLVTPLNSSALVPLPPITPKPHLEVSWANGYSLDNVVPGTRALSISREGLLTVNPSQKGVYVFSVLVEEWRDGEKLGEVQRDFQMLVIDGCTPPDPPKVAVSIPGRPDFDAENDILSFTLSDDKCFEFVVTNVAFGETISLRAKGVNFDGYLDEVFQFNKQTVTPGQDSLIVEVCMPGCPPVRNGPFIIDLIAADDACPVPQLDTARLRVEVQPPPNEFPVIGEAVIPTYQVVERDSLKLAVVSTDADNDSIELTLEIKGVEDPSVYGFELITLSQCSGVTEAQLIWRTDCKLYDFSDIQFFEVGIHAEDLDDCQVESPSIGRYNMEVVLPDNTIPQISAAIDDSVAIILGDDLIFDVSATDLDMDQLNLALSIGGVDLEVLGIGFDEVSGVGSVQSTFKWETSCDQLGIIENTTYELRFHSEDFDYCQVTNTDQEVIKVYMQIPGNNKPEFEFYADTTININELFELDISAFDNDFGDSVTVEFFNPARLPRSEIIEFEKQKGFGQVTSTFRWLPGCSLFDLGETSTEVEIPFIAYDDNCIVSRLDTMAIRFEVVQTREQFNQFLPPNVFTPNGDGINDVYTLTNLVNPVQNLPIDNCDDMFQYFSVFDRSGVEVFHSDNREFQWNGLNVDAGVYYYLIKFSRSEFKGYVHLLK